jgi:hypothetical protein
MTVPLRHGVVVGRGHRTVATLSLIAERDRLLVEAAAKFYSGLSGREAARHLRVALLRYREGAWRRTRAEAVCPARNLGRLEELLWRLLKVRDHVPSDRSVRTALARGEQASNGEPEGAFQSDRGSA